MPAKKKSDKGSGFAGKVSGKTQPKGTTYKVNADGTMVLIPPKKSSKKK